MTVNYHFAISDFKAFKEEITHTHFDNLETKAFSQRAPHRLSPSSALARKRPKPPKQEQKDTRLDSPPRRFQIFGVGARELSAALPQYLHEFVFILPEN